MTSGRLVTPFAHSLELEGGFYLIYPKAYAYPRKVADFRNWLLEEAGQPWHHQRRPEGVAGMSAKNQ